MPRVVRALLVLGSALLISLSQLVVVVPSSTAATAPTHTLSVSTAHGAAMYPSFTRSVQRYGVTTTDQTAGELVITAATSDPHGVVLVDGEPMTGGQSTVTGLQPGDEVSVIFQDSGGSEPHALVYLPVGFPTMHVTSTGPTASGLVLMNLSKYTAGPTPNFEVAVDDNGVPAYVRSFPNAQQSADLKPAPGGHYTVARSPTPTSGRTGSQLVELDSQFHVVRGYETVGLTNTDQHDAIMLPGGGRIMMAYEPNSVTGKVDPVIQEIDAQGHVVYTWNAADHVDPAALTVDPSNPDYGHLNSLQQLPNGDILASFRLFSSVFKIAWSDHDGFHRGDVMWKLGGRDSDFTFTNDDGPCAQHYARMLPNGHVLLFDNGSGGIGPAYCVDQSDPSGPAVTRPSSRAVEYSLDEQAHTATRVWQYAPTGWYAYFAGSAQRLGNGDTLVGWAAETKAIASEVDAAGNLVWQLTNSDGYFAYRVDRGAVPDTVKPTLDLTGGPAQGAAFAYGQSVTAAHVRCTDVGGSTLRTCSATRVDTHAPGRHTFVASATDGAGNTTRVTRSYTVAAAPYSRPDALVRRGAPRAWVGDGVYGSYGSEHVTARIAKRWHKAYAVVRVQAEGNRSDTYRLTGVRSTRAFSVRYAVGGADLTSAFTSGGWRRALRPGQYVDVVVTVTRLPAARRRSSLAAVVRAYSVLDWRRSDLAGMTVRGGRR